MTKLALSLVLFATACASSEAAPEPIATAQPASIGDDVSTCVETMTRNRTCTDAWIPALVDARARHDQPPGIRDAVAQDRDAVIAQAKTEWATDSTDEAIAQTCQKMAAQGAAPADLEAARGCLGQTACDAYVACVTPLFEKHFTK